MTTQDPKSGGTPPAPTAKAAAAPNAYTQIHEVHAGDTLSKIAQKYYGDPALYKDIFEANRDVLKDPNKIFPGQKLKIP